MRRLIYVDGIPENHQKNSRQITLDQTRLDDFGEDEGEVFTSPRRRM